MSIYFKVMSIYKQDKHNKGITFFFTTVYIYFYKEKIKEIWYEN
jgi:hypothetical protein